MVSVIDEMNTKESGCMVRGKRQTHEKVAQWEEEGSLPPHNQG